MNHSKLGFYKKKMYIVLSREHEDMPASKTLNPRKKLLVIYLKDLSR